MPQKQAGTARVHGADMTLAFVGSLASASELQSHSVEDQFDISDSKDRKGDIVGRHATNRQRMAEFEIWFKGATPAAAAAATKFPTDMFGLVSIAGSNLGFYDGDWNYIGGRYNGTHETYHSVTLRCWQGGSGASPAALPLVAG